MSPCMGLLTLPRDQNQLCPSSCSDQLHSSLSQMVEVPCFSSTFGHLCANTRIHQGSAKGQRTSRLPV